MLENLTTIAVIIAIVITVLLFITLLNSRKKSETKVDNKPIKNLEVATDVYDVDESQDEYDTKPKQTATREDGPRKKADRRVRQRRSKTRKEPDRRVAQRRDVPKDLVVTKDNFKIFSGLRILVAEDNIINQKVIQGLLANSGMEIIIANDGQEALDILEKDENFFIILMDSNMPILDGKEASKRIRQNPRYNHIPIIAHSGDTATDDINIMIDAGMEEHLAKPLSIVELYKVLYVYKKDEKKELNIKRGLEICGGNKEFYLEILHDFVSKYSDSAKILHTLLLNKQIQEADKLLLDLNGIAANLGAELLYDATAELKEVIHTGDKLAYMTKYKEYEAQLNNLLEVIEVYL